MKILHDRKRGYDVTDDSARQFRNNIVDISSRPQEDSWKIAEILAKMELPKWEVE